MNPAAEASLATPVPPQGRRGARAFGLMWGGQLVSLVGSGITRFALGVWVFEATGSVTQFTFIAISAMLPGLLVSPLAGALVDGWSRRAVMLGAAAGKAAATLALATLLWTGDLGVGHVYAFAATASLLDAFHWPAYVAATTLLVPKRHLGRASGLMQFGQALSGVLAPLPAGLLLVAIGLPGVVLVDFATFGFAFVTLLWVRIPRAPASADGREAEGSLWRRAAYGWTFIRRRPGLLGLLVYFALINLTFSAALVLATPLVLSFAAPPVLGMVLSVGNAGLLLGSVVMATTGGPRPRIHGVLGSGILFGAGLAGAALRADPTTIAVSFFVVMLGAPFINGCSQAIWQVKVPPDVQGRVFAMRRLIAQSTGPVGLLVAGPLADRVFEPLMAEGGALAARFGPLLGSGDGRGVALLYALMALAPLCASAWGYASPRVRRVEAELPDATDELVGDSRKLAAVGG